MRSLRTGSAKLDEVGSKAKVKTVSEFDGLF